MGYKTTNNPSLIDAYLAKGLEIWVVNHTEMQLLIPFSGPKGRRLTVSLDPEEEPANLSSKLDKNTIENSVELRRLIRQKHLDLIDPNSLDEDGAFEVDGLDDFA